MLLDLLCTDNYISFNIKVANSIGLHSAIYVNEILNIMKTAVRKKKIENNFIRVDRDWVAQRTTLPIEEQLAIDKKLAKIDLVVTDAEDPSKIKLNLDVLTNLMAEDDVKIINKVKKVTEVKKGSITGKQSVRQQTICNLKSYIQCSNEELLEAYRDWVDGVYARPNGFLSKKAIEVFQHGVDAFAKGDLDLALKIIEIATLNGYRVVDWAIEVFKKDYAKSFYAQYSTPAPAFANTPAVSVSEEVF